MRWKSCIETKVIFTLYVLRIWVDYADDQDRAFILYLVADWYDKLNIAWLFVYLCIVKGCFFYLI